MSLQKKIDNLQARKLDWVSWLEEQISNLCHFRDNPSVAASLFEQGASTPKQRAFLRDALVSIELSQK